MILYPDIQPVAFSIGPLKVHWYGITYLVAFAGCWLLLQYRGRKGLHKLTSTQIEDLIFYAALGVILGGRIGYTLFYNLDNFLANPLVLLQIWNGGMSFHGGLLGVGLALWLYAKKIQISLFTIFDTVAVVTPFGLACGRIGNFINAELWGRPTDLPWAMVFPTDPLALPRHPSMLYEMLLEGVLLLLIMWRFTAKRQPPMAATGLFLACYGSFRFAVEFVRQPDAQMGVNGFIYDNWLTQGMILSTPMILGGIFLLFYACNNKN